MKEELKEKRERKEKLGWKDKRETWAQKEIEVYLGHLESKELKDLKVPRVQKDHQERLDQLDHLERKEKMDLLDLLVILVDLVIKETKEPKEGMDHLVLKEKGVKMVFKEKGDKQDLEVSEEELVDLEALE